MNGLYFIILIAIGLLLFVNGLKKESQMSLFFGGVALIIPILYFTGIQSWSILLPLVPAISLLLTYLVNKKLSPA